MKEAWEVVKTMRLGADRVKDVNAQKLMQEFENIKFKEGESIDDFGMCINNLVGNLRALGETMEDTRVVKKFLRVVPSRFASVVVSIEMFCDMKALTVEELVGRLRAAEERLNDGVEQVTNKAGRLLLAEEDWLERNKHRLRGVPNKEGAGGSGGGQTKNKAPAACSQGGNNGGVKLTSMGTPRRKGHCRNCGIYGHWAEDCKRPKKEKKKEAQQPEANVVVAGHEQGALMLATCDVVHAPHQIVHMTENVIPVEVPNDEWGYRFFDRATKKLVVSRDVIFDEKHPFDWANVVNSEHQSTDTFVVNYESTDENPTTTGNVVEQATENQGGGAVEPDGDMQPGFATPSPQNAPGSDQGPAAQWATPPSAHSEETFGGPLRFRTLDDLFGSTDEIQDYEYSGVCLLAADEPSGVEQALEEKCWCIRCLLQSCNSMFS
ncbi:unnamed protein product [Miscanthus lutarioriparius]|uniref:CCHC-type domain-containing protein n=1 Tax=Miscanthus lutarioriparius TaxID=422564 RepID=A0A811SAA7_9POAL|nr:unnamed protein product [Miscanthus lutarioriparius]